MPASFNAPRKSQRFDAAMATRFSVALATSAGEWTGERWGDPESPEDADGRDRLRRSDTDPAAPDDRGVDPRLPTDNCFENRFELPGV
eukprot:gene5139-biopygen3187